MQSTWKSYRNLQNARRDTRGNTRQAIDLIAENLYVGETADWLFTATVQDFSSWNDGCLVLTDKRLFVSYALESTGQIFGNMIAVPPAPTVNQLQGGGFTTTFQVVGLPVQAIGLQPNQFSEFMNALDSVEGGASSMGGAPQAQDPVEALTTAQRLLDNGLITEAEYEDKKAEILKRL